MKRMLMVAMALAVGGLFAAEQSVIAKQTSNGKPAATSEKTAKISLAEARGQIDQAIASPAKMRELVTGLSAEDQKQFLADVNKAISEMPASPEEKTAKFLDCNRAAIGVATGNVPAMTAEMFATVPPESLTVMVEQLSADIFNRSADPKVTISDAEFTQIATEIMNAVNERCEETDNGSPRSALAIVLFLKASNGSPADLADKLIDTMKHEDARSMARSEWIPAAVPKDVNQQPSFEPILASADAGLRPDVEATLVLTAGAMFHDAVLSDMTGKNGERDAFAHVRTPILDAIENVWQYQTPNFGGDRPGSAGQAGGAGGIEPGGYPNQNSAGES